MTTKQPVLLVIDDEPGMLSLVDRIVRPAGFTVVRHTSAREALASLAASPADVALVDLQMPEIGGLEVLKAIREMQPQCAVILMTAHAAVESAIEAVKLGALDYLSKPLDIDRLRQLLDEAREDAARRAALLSAESQTAHRLELCGMIGRSAVMQELFGLVRRIAPHARTALITGETGSGKEGIARAVHELGPRRQRKFVTINCSAVVETLFESELFGHMRGAFTGATDHKAGLFEAADGGTLFLDEIGELPAAVQAKLLRVIENGEVQRVGSLQPKKVDVRIVAATNRDLKAEAEAGKFRGDLYYRLNVVELAVPPLRERPQDIPYLTAAFVKEFSVKFRKPIDGVSPAAERLMMTGEWLGNVRELRNVLERACMLAEGRTLTERDIQSSMPSSSARGSRGVDRVGRNASPPSLTDDLDAVERDHIVRVLAEERGNKRAAAERLGLSRRTLYRRLERHQLLDPSHGAVQRAGHGDTLDG
ncbi:MAG TPA: sigma-54 dependent transcriptional regulator [Vicinamibacterales bacterium]|nr:sigma-54 dependent transcriptional regulator [Vicinamibacterales bacterium]